MSSETWAFAVPAPMASCRQDAQSYADIEPHHSPRANPGDSDVTREVFCNLYKL